MLHALQMTGYLFWRGGLLIAGTWSLLWLGKWLFALWLLPQAVNWGLAMLAAGLTMILLSLILESRGDTPPPGDDEIGVNP